MSHSHIKMLAAAAVVTALATPGFAQGLLQDAKPTLQRSDDAKKADADYDKQFRSRSNSDDPTAAKADPWGTVRTPAAQQPTAAKKPTTTSKNN